MHVDIVHASYLQYKNNILAVSCLKVDPTIQQNKGKLTFWNWKRSPLHIQSRLAGHDLSVVPAERLHEYVC